MSHRFLAEWEANGVLMDCISFPTNISHRQNEVYDPIDEDIPICLGEKAIGKENQIVAVV